MPGPTLRARGPAALLTPVLLLAAVPDAPARAATILAAHFDDKTVDAPIGLGGAAAGEPIADVTTIPQYVRQLPFPTPCLEVADYTGSTETLRFEFLDDALVTSGRLAVEFWVRFDEYSNYSIRLRERGTSSVNYLDLNLGTRALGGGIITYHDHSGFGGDVGDYEADEFIFVRILYNLDTWRYAVEWNGVEVLEDQSPPLPGGIGAVLFSTPSDADGLGNMYVDDLVVRATDVQTAVEPSSWGEVKAAWR